MCCVDESTTMREALHDFDHGLRDPSTVHGGTRRRSRALIHRGTRRDAEKDKAPDSRGTRRGAVKGGESLSVRAGARNFAKRRELRLAECLGEDRGFEGERPQGGEWEGSELQRVDGGFDIGLRDRVSGGRLGLRRPGGRGARFFLLAFRAYRRYAHEQL